MVILKALDRSRSPLCKSTATFPTFFNSVLTAATFETNRPAMTARVKTAYLFIVLCVSLLS